MSKYKKSRKGKSIMNKKFGFLILFILFVIPFIIQPEVSVLENFAYGILSLSFGGLPVLLCIIDDSPDDSIGG